MDGNERKDGRSEEPHSPPPPPQHLCWLKLTKLIDEIFKPAPPPEKVRKWVRGFLRTHASPAPIHNTPPQPRSPEPRLLTLSAQPFNSGRSGRGGVSVAGKNRLIRSDWRLFVNASEYGLLRFVVYGELQCRRGGIGYFRINECSYPKEGSCR